LGEQDRNVVNVNVEICQKVDPLSTDRLAGEKGAFWNSDRNNWMPPKAANGFGMGRDAENSCDRENLESDGRLGLADGFGDLGGKPSPSGGAHFNQFMKSKNNSACNNGNFFLESTGLDVEFFEGQGFGLENQENSNKKSMVMNLQNRDEQIRQPSLDLENFQKKYQIKLDSRQSKQLVYPDENCNAKYFPSSKPQEPQNCDPNSQNCEPSQNPQNAHDTSFYFMAPRNEAQCLTPEIFNRSKSHNIVFEDQAKQRKAAYLAKLEKDCLGRRQKRSTEMQVLEQNLKRTPKHSQKGDSSFVGNATPCDRSFSNFGERRQLATRRHGDLDKQVREKRRIEREIKKLERSGANDYLTYKDKRDVENQSYLARNVQKLDSFDNSQVQAQIFTTEAFLYGKKVQKENEKRRDNVMVSSQVNKEKQKYEDSYKNWELKSQLYGTELQKQIHEKKLKLVKENFENKENKSFVGSFHAGGKTPEKITAYNRPNKILQSKLRNYSDIMKDKENCAKRAITPKPRVAGGTGVRVSKAQPKKIDIGKNLVAKDLYNELRFQITGKN
jgi:hypothetical protein